MKKAKFYRTRKVCLYLSAFLFIGWLICWLVFMFINWNSINNIYKIIGITLLSVGILSIPIIILLRKKYLRKKSDPNKKRKDSNNSSETLTFSVARLSLWLASFWMFLFIMFLCIKLKDNSLQLIEKIRISMFSCSVISFEMYNILYICYTPLEH